MMNRNVVYVVGLGPGNSQFLTAQAAAALDAADVLCGYTVYVELIRARYPSKEICATGMTKEIDRCRWALQTAQSGKTVALVCSGDAGVYGMASPLLELAPACPGVEVEIIPGLTAALSGGRSAPAHRWRMIFCVVSLSDRLTPWAVIESGSPARRWGISALPSTIHHPRAAQTIWPRRCGFCLPTVKHPIQFAVRCAI